MVDLDAALRGDARERETPDEGDTSGSKEIKHDVSSRMKTNGTVRRDDK